MNALPSAEFLAQFKPQSAPTRRDTKRIAIEARARGESVAEIARSLGVTDRAIRAALTRDAKPVSKERGFLTCPHCSKTGKHSTVETRGKGGMVVTRRRECFSCERRFSTVETIVP
jgi:predicted transcriptional regulator